MTREEAKELLPIIQAFAEGKIIQYKGKCGKWINCANDSAILDISTGPSCFRIKPEPKYRPFRTQEECWEEMHKHSDFGWLKSKGTGSVGLIGTLYEKDKALMMIWATNENISFSASDVFNDYVFTDNAPFGIKEE